MTLPNVLRWCRMAMVAGAATLVMGASAAAQSPTGSIRGFVTGTGGEPLADATVTARNPATNQERTTTTNPAGFYFLGGLRPASYEIVVRRIGMSPKTQTLVVGVGQSLNLDFQLGETTVQLQEVQVVAQASQAERQTSEVATNITRGQIENLPLRDRNFLDLARLAPGVNAQKPGDDTKFIQAGAQPAEQVNVFVDGTSYKNDILKGGVAGQDASEGNPFPQGAVQEFRVITQNFKAEYQKAASAIITATTRSGTNNFEADAFAYGVQKGFVARDPIAVREGLGAPDFQRLQLGGSVAGAITPDRLFYFATYEGNLRDEPQDVLLGADAANAPPGLNPSQFTGRFTQQFREHLGFGKITYIPSDRSTFDFSANIRKETDVQGFGGQTSFQSAENVRQNIYTGVGNWRYAGDRWLNEAQISGQSYQWNPVPEDMSTPGRNFFGIIRVGGRDTRQDFTQKRISLRDDITRAAVQFGGDHVIKGGVNVDFLRYHAEKFFNANPVFNFRADENYLFPFEALFGFGNPTQNANNTQIGAYVQDDWTVTPRLVLNLGIRWDMETNGFNNDYVTPQALRDSLSGPLRSTFRPEIDQFGGLENFLTSGSSDRPAYKKAFQPRAGFSYDLTGDHRTVIFGGAGVYYDRDYWNLMLDEEFRRNFKVLRIQFDTLGPRPECTLCVKWDDRFLDPAQLRELAMSGQAGVPEVFLINNNTVPPKSYNFSAGIRQAVGAVNVTATYTAVRGYNGLAFIRATDGGALQPTYAQAFISTNDVRTWYDALLLKVEKPLLVNSRWGGMLSYTFADAQQQGEFFFSLDDRFRTVKDYPKQKSPNAQEHTIVANAVYRAPWDVMFSTLVNLGSGFTQLATDASNGFGPTERRTYVFEPPKRSFLGMGHVFAIQNVDFRLEKQFPFGTQRVGVLLDVFNAFNQSNFSCFETTIQPTGQSNANLGKPGCAAEGRRLQIGLQYGFSARSDTR